MAYKETYNISGENLLKKVKDLFNETNVTKITIADKNEKEIISFPVSIGIIGGIAAIVAECKIIVERKDDEPSKEQDTTDEEEINPLV